MKDEQSSLTEPAAAGTSWTVGGDTSLQAVLEHRECPSLIADALTGVLSWQVRVETHVRRAIASPRLAPQLVAALLALGCEVTLKGADGPERAELAALVEGNTAGRVLALHVPRGAPGCLCGKACVARTPADDPIVSAYAVIETDGRTVQAARVALTGVWPEPARLAQAPASLVGSPLSEVAVRAVASAVAREAEPSGDYVGSAEYRQAMAEVLSRRALEQCVHGERADR